MPFSDDENFTELDKARREVTVRYSDTINTKVGKTEAAEPMADLWSGFIRLVQHPRDHYGAQQMSSVLSKEESEAISLKNNADIFPGMSKQPSYLIVVLPTGGTFVSDFLFV